MDGAKNILSPQDRVCQQGPWRCRLTGGLDFTPAIMHKFGVSRRNSRTAQDIPWPRDDSYQEGNTVNPGHLSLMDFMASLYKDQCLDQPHLDVMSPNFSACLETILRGENLNFCTTDYEVCLYHIGMPGQRREVALHPLVSGAMLQASPLRRLMQTLSTQSTSSVPTPGPFSTVWRTWLDSVSPASPAIASRRAFGHSFACPKSGGETRASAPRNCSSGLTS
jgi:hypothetical protein